MLHVLHFPLGLRIASLYLALGSLWILLSDRLIATHQTLKGLGFVLVSGLLIAVLTQHAWRAHERSESRFRAVIEHAWDIISIVDPDGTRRYHSPAIERVLGYRASDTLGQDILGFVHPDDQPGARQLLGEIGRQPGASVATELRVTHADGSLRHLHVTATNLLEEPAVEGIVLNSRDVTKRKEAERQIQRQLEQLAALHTIVLAILESHDLATTLDVVLEQVLSQLGVDSATILLYDAESQELSYAAGRGFRSCAIRQSRVKLGEGYAGRALSDRQPQVIRQLSEAQHDFTRSDFITDEDFVAYLALPLIANGQPKGVLDLFSRVPLDPSEDWLAFAQALVAQAAIAIDNAQLFTDLQQATVRLEVAYDRTLEGWALALELRDDETEGHSQRVVGLSLELGRQLGMSDEELVHLRRGALLHDIGKIGVPDAVLLKPGPLDEQEWALM